MIALRAFALCDAVIIGSAARFYERDRVRREVNLALEILTMEAL
jgi:hypothetical protein